MSRTRLSREDRREMILQAAIDAAEDLHYLLVKRSDIANRVGASVGLVSWYLGTTTDMREVIMTEALHRRRVLVVAQGLLARDPVAMKADSEIREQAKEIIDMAVNV